MAKRERTLLVAAGVFVLLNYALLAAARPNAALWPFIIWVGGATLAHIWLERTLPQRDPFIMPIVLLLVGWGMTLVARLAPAFELRQVLWFALSLSVGLVIAVMPPELRLLRRYKYTWLTVGLLLLLSTILFGVHPTGVPFAPQLWLGFGGVFFQPSELLKLLLIVFLASYLSEKSGVMAESAQVGPIALPHLRYLAPMVIMWGICMVLLVWQRDLGSASLFFIVFLSMLYIATENPIYLILGSGLLVVAALAGYQLFDVVELRVDAWLNPWADPDNRSFQIVQSLLAIAAGGLFGEGFGLGSPTFIPVVHSDFVFAAVAEEYGLLGSIGLMACMAVLMLRAMRIGAANESRPFHALLAAGIGILFGVQTLLIVGGVIKLIPLTGVTLPFVSYGGSSLLISFAMVGLLLRISDAQSRFEVPRP